MGSNSEVITALIKAGANINATGGEYGWTPLMFAAYDRSEEVDLQLTGNGESEAVITLLEFGADPKVKDSYNQRAIDFARANEKLKGTDGLKKLETVSR